MPPVPPKSFRHWLATVLLLTSAAAAAKDYEVELVVFDRLGSGVESNEQWDFTSPRIIEQWMRMAAMQEEAADHPVSEELTHLDQIRRSLLLAGHRVLATAHWRQPTSTHRDAPLISIGKLGTPLPVGFMRIYTTTLIYADVDLQLSPLPPPLPPTVIAPPRPHYFIAEKRRLRFGEIHYIDHPYFGAILGVWQATDEEPAPLTPAEPTATPPY